MHSYTFPAVEKNLTGLRTVGKLILTCPSVEITACSSMAFIGIGKGKYRSSEDFLRFKSICRVVGIYTCIELMVGSLMCLDTKFVIAAVAKSGSDDLTCMLQRFSVKREHHFRVIRMSISYSVLVSQHKHTTFKRFLYEASFIVCRTGEMCKPYIAVTDRNRA